MLDLKQIRENPDLVRRAIADKRVSLDLDALLAADKHALSLSRALQELQEKRNHNAKSIPKASAAERPELIAEGRRIGDEIAAMKPAIDAAEAALRDFLLLVPNVPAASAPRGLSEADNVVVKLVGEPTRFDFTPRDHVALLDKNNWAELLRVAKVAGSRSYALKGDGVLLEQSLLRFALDRLVERGFTPVSVPSFANESAFVGRAFSHRPRAGLPHRAGRQVPHRYLRGDAKRAAQRRNLRRGGPAGALRRHLVVLSS